MFDPRNGAEAMFKAWGALAIAVSYFAVRTTAHEHHMDKIEEGQAVSADPIDTILWVHILIQTLAWGVLFPTGMVLGVHFLLYAPQLPI